MKLLFLLLAQAPAPVPPPLPHPTLPLPENVPLPPPWWIGWAVGLLLVLLIALVIWLLLRPKHVPVAPLRQPWTSAFRALNDLRARMESIPPQDMSHRVSQILRRYLMERYSVPAPARTTSACPECPCHALRVSGVSVLSRWLGFVMIFHSCPPHARLRSQ